jgi:hypothetical protein
MSYFLKAKNPIIAGTVTHKVAETTLPDRLNG